MGPALAQADVRAVGVGSQMAADGSRYVAFSRPDGVPAVLDSRTGKVRKIQGANGCRPVDIGAGRVLLDCSGQFEKFEPARLAPVTGGRSNRVKWSNQRVDFTEVGRFWLRGQPVCPAACSAEIYLNRRSGAKRIFKPGDSFGRHSLLSYADLDLNRKKLRLRPHPEFSPRLNPMSLLAFNRNVYVTEESRSLWVWTSAKHRIRIGAGIGGTASNPRSLSLGSGRVTWVKGRKLFSFELATHCGIERSLPRNGARVTPVEGGAVVAVPSARSGKPKNYRIRVIRFG